MINRKLNVLAGSILVATGSQAAIDLSGGELLAVFNTPGQGSYYQFVPGVTAETLLSYQHPVGIPSFSIVGNGSNGGLSIDISSATAALGGEIDSFALLALYDSGEPTTFNYYEFLYVEVGSGLLFSGPGYSTEYNLLLANAIFNLQARLSYSDLGHNEEGSLGDFDSTALSLYYLTDSPNQITASFFTDFSITNTSQFTIDPPILFTPLPATAWLFLSAVGGLVGATRLR